MEEVDVKSIMEDFIQGCMDYGSSIVYQVLGWGLYWDRFREVSGDEDLLVINNI